MPWLATRCLCVFVWAHGLLFVVGAMCSPVYCKTPPFLLSHYSFSYIVIVILLVCLPIYSPGVCSPVLFGCLMSDVTSCVCVISACLLVFLPRGCFCFFLLFKKPTFSCTWALDSSLFTQQDKNVTKDSSFISCSFELWTVTKSAISTKIWSSTTVFNTNNNKEYSWSSILEWFLKDQVIIKTGVMMQI